MKNLLDKDINNKALIYFSGLLKNIEYFSFYGTLLGIVRTGETLDKDDDIDILVNVEQYQIVLKLIEEKQLNIIIKSENVFLQVEKELNGNITLLSIHFYKMTENLIIDKWAFAGFPNDRHNHLNIDKKLVFPLKSISLDGHHINIPNESKKLCEFLYGEKYKIPIEKDSYDIVLINNRPVIRYKHENNRSLLLYNLYPKNDWKKITNSIIGNVPHHNSILINISLDRSELLFKRHHFIKSYLLKIPKVDRVIISRNEPSLAEQVGFNNLRANIDYDDWDIITYTHSKGVTQPAHSNIIDWVAMMKYFLIDRHDLCINAFNDGYYLYGTQLRDYKYYKIRQHAHLFSDYHYSGNFVSVNMKALKREFISTICPNDYYGTEAFFGNLCEIDKAFCVHSTSKSLYLNPYPKEKYIL